jgi:CheY-like chemotaxis protein
MSKVFILEDNEDRISIFKKNIKCDELVIARSFSEAVQFWRDKYFDVVFLDHDLGGETHSDCLNNNNTGCRFARLYATSLFSCLVFVHSMNLEGRKEISLIANGSEIPFVCINWENLNCLLNDPSQIKSQIENSIQ